MTYTLSGSLEVFVVMGPVGRLSENESTRRPFRFEVLKFCKGVYSELKSVQTLGDFWYVHIETIFNFD